MNKTASGGKNTSAGQTASCGRTTIALLLLVLPMTRVPDTRAQEPVRMNLTEAIQTALDSNLSVRSAALSVEAGRALKAASADLPKTDFEGEYGQFNSYTKDNGITVSQTLSFPTVYIKQYRLADAALQSSRWQFSGAQVDIATQVKQLYWQYVYLASRKDLLVYKDSLYEGVMRAAELRAATGETNRLEMISARSQSLEIRNQLNQAAADMAICSRKLAVLLNSRTPVLPSDTVLRLITLQPAEESAPLARNATLGYLQQRAEVARAEKQLEMNRLLPDLSIGFFSQTIIGSQEVGGLERTFGKDYRFTGVQAGISLPLWIGPFLARGKAASITYRAALADAEHYRVSAAGEYQSLLDEYNKYMATVAYYEDQALTEAELIIEQATRSFRAGALDYIEYVVTVDRALAIRQNYLDALNGCNQAIILIDRITGRIW